MTHRIQDAPDVDVENTAIRSFGRLIQRAFPFYAGIVKADVEAAEFVDRKIDHPFHVRILPHVGADERRLTAEFLNFSDDLCAFFFTATSQNDLRASASELDRGGFANTRRSSGYERNFTREYFVVDGISLSLFFISRGNRECS
jgi:hypothetical protein